MEYAMLYAMWLRLVFTRGVWYVGRHMVTICVHPAFEHEGMTPDMNAGADVQIGDDATLFGPGGLTASELAFHCGTINYEILTGVQGRVARVYVDESIVVDARHIDRSPSLTPVLSPGDNRGQLEPSLELLPSCLTAQQMGDISTLPLD